MADFRIKLKLTGFELEVEGSREDAPQIAANLGQQFSGLLGPAVGIVEGEVVEVSSPTTTQAAGASAAAPATVKRATRRGRRPAALASVAGSIDGTALITWKHNPDTWGSPQQSWSGTEKAIWFLYVAGQEGQKQEMGASQLANSFNKMFREAGLIQRKNMARDLGSVKRAAPALLGEDTSKDPSEWFLTSEGKKKAEELVKQARGAMSATA